ncbi:hypothetical protein BpHYR1_042825 [Brachionus plicatilis]|uniref:Uncharacterized protein n=1 Tax=Brachionus plicatilis TaxID=10195 RepID=A0A3M7QRE4_BRAPC|nr:hypothetical protein BpHYR1_042825 [Brachionus plicatilis]
MTQNIWRYYIVFDIQVYYGNMDMMFAFGAIRYRFRLGNKSGVDDQLDAVTSVSARNHRIFFNVVAILKLFSSVVRGHREISYKTSNTKIKKSYNFCSKSQKLVLGINLHRFCRLLQKVKQQLFHFVSFTEQFCMKFHDAVVRVIFHCKFVCRLLKPLLIIDCQHVDMMIFHFLSY